MDSGLQRTFLAQSRRVKAGRCQHPPLTTSLSGGLLIRAYLDGGFFSLLDANKETAVPLTPIVAHAKPPLGRLKAQKKPLQLTAANAFFGGSMVSQRVLSCERTPARERWGKIARSASLSLSLSVSIPLCSMSFFST